MIGLWILSISVLFNLCAIFLFIRLIKFGNKRSYIAWIVFSFTLILLAAWRTVSLYFYINNDPIFMFDWRNELLHMILSFLMILGAITVKPLFIERAKAEMKFQQTHQRLNDIIDFLPDATFVIDNEKKVIAWNRAIEKMTGVQKKDILGRSDYSACFYNETRPILIDIALSPTEKINVDYPALEVIGNEVFGESYVPKVWNNNGAFCWGAACKLFDNEGNLVGAIESVRDITERKRAEEAMIRLNAVLERKVAQIISELREKDQMMILQSRQAAMGEMLRNIAHQWRQPLNVIGIHIQNLLDKQKNDHLEPSELEHTVIKTMGLIQHMSGTIDDFRNFFKPEKIKTEFSLIAAVENALGFVKALFKNHGIETIVDCSGPLTVVGYPNELSQVIMNILNNAMDAFKEHPPASPLIHFRIFYEDRKKVITVFNNAGEIRNDVITKIFDPYFTTKEMGTGIGLYMAKTIIEKNMNGKLDVRNVNGGAEFRIEL